MIKSILVAIGLFGLLGSSFAEALCPSTVMLNIKTNMGHGTVKAELRRGNRPGSSLVSAEAGNPPMAYKFDAICPGRYFFAIYTGDSPDIKVTQYFDVVVRETPDGYSYSNPRIDVFIQRAKGNQKSNLITSVSRREL